MSDLATISAIATGLGAGLFGWLKGKSDERGKAYDASAAEANARTEQMKILTSLVQSQGQQITALLEARNAQSNKISSLSSKIDTLNTQLSQSTSESQMLRTDLAEAQADIRSLQRHVSALEKQVTDMGGTPVPAPRGQAPGT